MTQSLHLALAVTRLGLALARLLTQEIAHMASSLPAITARVTAAADALEGLAFPSPGVVLQPGDEVTTAAERSDLIAAVGRIESVIALGKPPAPTA